ALDPREHERAHIDSAEECMIMGYTIKANKKFRLRTMRREPEFWASVRLAKDLPHKDAIRICMAPELPSVWDFFNVMCRLGYKDELDIVKGILKRGGTFLDYKADLLSRASSYN
ncbi:MAG TPA: hypothetical protein VMZ91_12725, partial [Candidatus Paceibacterota bacterium]|nr:hypothetical protein [Candidatus Paceibacterota bacterium]